MGTRRVSFYFEMVYAGFQFTLEEYMRRVSFYSNRVHSIFSFILFADNFLGK